MRVLSLLDDGIDRLRGPIAAIEFTDPSLAGNQHADVADEQHSHHADFDDDCADPRGDNVSDCRCDSLL